MVYTSMSSYPPFLYGGETFHFEGYSCHELKMLLYHFYSLVVIIYILHSYKMNTSFRAMCQALYQVFNWHDLI